MIRGRRGRSANRETAAIGALTIAVLLSLAAAAPAATIKVHNDHDHGPGSLRKAIQRAGIGDTIRLPEGHYTLTTGELTIDQPLRIIGAGAAKTVIDAGGDSRVLELSSGADPVTLSKLTITGGRSSAGGGIYNSGDLRLTKVTVRDNVAAGTLFNIGGGILDVGTLKLKRVLMRGNRTSNSAEGFGGAIGGGRSSLPVGPITIDRSRFTHNSAPFDGFGGAIALQPLSNTTDSMLNITRTRLDHNSASSGESFSGTGGALFFNPYVGAPVAYPLILDGDTFDHNRAGKAGDKGFGGGVDISVRAQVAGSSTPVSIANTTITDNREIGTAGNGIGGGLILDLAGSGGGVSSATLNNVTIAGNTAAGQGGGVYATVGGAGASAPVFSNSIIASNSAATGGNCFGPLSSGGYNLDSGATCALTAAGDLQGKNPKLEKLRDNGGPTPTRALKGDSPARNSGGDLSCRTKDQRGIARPQGPHCDIGAFEYVRRAHNGHH